MLRGTPPGYRGTGVWGPGHRPCHRRLPRAAEGPETRTKGEYDPLKPA